MNEETSRPASSLDLRREAQQLRREIRLEPETGRPRKISILRRLVLTLLTCVMLGLVLYLLLVPEARTPITQFVAARVAERIDPALQVFLLPPPPPKPVAQKVEVPSAPIVYEQKGFDGVLYATQYDLKPAPETRKKVQEAPAAEAPEPAKTEDDESAFNVLKEQVETVRQIVDGAREDFKFKEWSVLKKEPPVSLIDLLVTRVSDGRDIHLVWEVNLESGSARAMSQAARDLAALESRK